MQSIAFFLLSTLLCFSSCGPKAPRTYQNLPKEQHILQREGYCAGYDGRLKQSVWVVEELTKTSLSGKATRKFCTFREDPTLPKIIRSELSDYKNSGYDRGHLSPAANHKSSQLAMDESFFLSNMSPQTPQFNRGYWSKLEKYVRDLTNKEGRLRVISGPLFLPETSWNGKKYISYEVIGPNDVAVPTHFFKVIELKSTTEAYLLPNKQIDSATPLSTFQTTVEHIEKISGIVFQ